MIVLSFIWRLSRKQILIVRLFKILSFRIFIQILKIPQKLPTQPLTLILNFSWIEQQKMVYRSNIMSKHFDLTFDFYYTDWSSLFAFDITNLLSTVSHITKRSDAIDQREYIFFRFHERTNEVSKFAREIFFIHASNVSVYSSKLEEANEKIESTFKHNKIRTKTKFRWLVQFYLNIFVQLCVDGSYIFSNFCLTIEPSSMCENFFFESPMMLLI